MRALLVLLMLPVLVLFGCGSRPGASSSAARVEITAAQTTPTTAPNSTSTPAATPPALPPVTAAAIDHGNPSMAEVALVFNVGAGSEPATEVLDTLRAAHVPATFMVMGWLARRHPDIVRSIASAGFEIGSHGDEVADLTQVSDTQVATDLQDADAVLTPLIGHSTRPIWSPSAGAQDARVRRVAAGIGYDTVLWSIDSGDWRTDATASEVEQQVIPHLERGSIVVLHYDSPQSHEATVTALPLILAALKQRGLSPVPLTQLLAHLAASPESSGG